MHGTRAVQLLSFCSYAMKLALAPRILQTRAVEISPYSWLQWYSKNKYECVHNAHDNILWVIQLSFQSFFSLWVHLAAFFSGNCLLFKSLFYSYCSKHPINKIKGSFDLNAMWHHFFFSNSHRYCGNNKYIGIVTAFPRFQEKIT